MKTIFAVLFFAFAISGITAAESKVLSVSLERTVCFGTCPSYILTILADGSVTFEGRQYVEKIGVFKKKIPATKLTPIFKKIEEIHFWELEDSYQTKTHPDGSISMVTDMPTQYVTVKSSAKSKKIEDYYGSPPELQELEKLIDQVAGVDEWVGKSDGKKP